MTELVTERLRLRPFTQDDADDYNRLIHSDVDVMRFLAGEPRPIERTRLVIDKYAEHWAQWNYGPWAVLDRASGQFMGHCGLWTIPATGEVELMYALGKAWWGKRYASEAARAAVDFAFSQTPLEGIIALAFEENALSRRIIENLGMTFQSVTDQHFGVPLCYYKLSRED